MDDAVDEIQSTIQKRININTSDDRNFSQLFKGKVPGKKTIKNAISDLFE